MNRALLLALAALLSVPSTARGEEATEVVEARRWRVAIETDPLDFVLGGYALFVAVKPAPLPRWRFALGGYGLTAPDFMLGPANAGFRMRLPLALDAVASFYPWGGRGGFFVGGTAAALFAHYEHDDVPGAHADVASLGAFAHAGYQWFPFKGIGLYAMPWINAGATVALNGPPVVGAHQFQSSTFTFTPLVHFGFEL